MRQLLLVAAVAALLAIPSALAAQQTYNHGEIGAYGDLLRVAPAGRTATNYLGLGGRVGFNTGSHVALEAEMTYDFEQNYTNINLNNGSGGGTTTTYTAGIRPISGLFGPRFQFGTSGPFRAFVEGKAGFIDFSSSCNAPAGSGSCFSNSLSGFGGASTHFAAFPGGGIEAFFGPIGLRVDAGDEIWIDNGAYNNLRVTFGPTLRF